MTAFSSVYETKHGVGGVVANASGLVAVILPHADGMAGVLPQFLEWDAKLAASDLTDRAAHLLSRYFAGERITFSLPIDERHWTEFARNVYRATMAIPYGAVLSYGGIAQRCGSPGAARAVGRLMAVNRIPIIIPCHRVVAANGALTGYSGPGGVPFKAELLDLEGVSLTDGQKVRW